MSNNELIDSEKYIFNSGFDDSTIDKSDSEHQNSTSNEIKKFTSKILDSLKNSLLYSTNTEKIANQSLIDLCSQNDQINRIKKDLNKSHETMSLTEKLVDRYVSTLSWITSSIKWTDSIKLDFKQFENGFNVSNSDDNSPNDPISDKSEPVTGTSLSTLSSLETEGQFFSETTNGLNTLLSNMRNNRMKTDLLSSVIISQNDDLERINNSAQTLRNRVSKVNKILKK